MTPAAVAVYWSCQCCYVISCVCMLLSFLLIKLALLHKVFTCSLCSFFFLISNFRRVLNIVCVLLGISPASDCGLPTFRNPLSVPSSRAGCRVWSILSFYCTRCICSEIYLAYHQLNKREHHNPDNYNVPCFVDYYLNYFDLTEHLIREAITSYFYWCVPNIISLWH